MVTIALGILACAKALTSVLRTWIEQTSRTRRLTKALEGTRPNQRPEIILACSALEGTAAAKRGRETAVAVLPAEGHRWPPELAFQGKHDDERRKG